MKSRRLSRSAQGQSRRVGPLGAAALTAGALLSPGVGLAATQNLNVSGNWDTTSSIWDAGAVWTNGNDAVFGGTASAIEIAGDIQVSGIASANDVAFNNAVPGGTITFVSPATLSGGGDLTFNSAILGSSGLTIDNAGGVVTINGNAASLAGQVDINSGALVLGVAGNLNGVGISKITIDTGASLATSVNNQIGNTEIDNAGTFSLGGNDRISKYTSTGGTFTGTGTLTADDYELNDGSVVNGNLGSGNIAAKGTVAINGNAGLSGTTRLTVTEGTTTVNGTLGATTLTVGTDGNLSNGATGNLADTATLTLNDNGALTLGHNETIGSITGTGTVNLGSSTLTLSNGAGATSAAVISGTGGVALASGTQTLAGASIYTGATNVNGGTLALTGSLTSTTVNVADGAALTSTGGLADGTNLNLNTTGTVTLTGNETVASLTAGTGAVNAAGVDLTVTGAFSANGNVSVDDLAIGSLGGSGTINSTGVVTASSGSFSGVIATGSLVKDTAGSLTLSGVNTYTGGTNVTDGTLVLGHAFNTLADTGALTVQSGATVNLGANTDTVASFTSNGGTLAGTGTLTAATYALNDGTTVDANLGAGAITANGAVALNGASAAATLTVQSGTTTLAGAASATTVAVTGGTLDVTGTGSLANAATLNVSSGATFATQADERIADTVAVTNVGTLAIGGNETVGSLVNTGTISGAGTLTTANYQLGAGSNITGNLGAGTVNVSGNTGISGTAAAATVNVNAGTLTLTGNNLLDTAAVTNVSTLTLTGNDTIGSLVNTGTISGAGTLTAATYQLGTGSNITGNLGAGAVTVTGNTSISGTSAADTVAVNDGITLTLSGNNLADNTGLTLGTGATLNLLGDETVGSFINNAGLLSGFGKLTASLYTLNDGTVLNANIGDGDINTNGTVAINGTTGVGTLTVQTGQTTLDNYSAASDVVVSDGAALLLSDNGELNAAIDTIQIGTGSTLTTSGDNQLGDAEITNAGTFTLGGNDTVGAYVSNAGTFTGAGTLTAATYALNDGTTITGNLGAGDLTANGTVQIDGTKGIGALTVQSGETTLNNTASSTDVTVSGGTLALTASGSLNNTATVDIASGGTVALGASDQLADAADVTNAGTLALGANSDTVGTYAGGGALTGTGTLTATTYALTDGAVIDADLGTGTLTSDGTVAINGDAAASSFTVQSGTTTLAGDAAATTVQVDDTAALVTTATGTLAATADVTLVGTGALTLGQNQTLASITADTGAINATDTDLTVTGTLDADGTLSVNNLTVGTLTGDVDVTATSDVTVTTLDGTAAASLDVAGTTTASDGTYDGTILSGDLVKTSVGTLTLTGANTYTGATNVNGGTLALTGSLASTGVNVATGAAITSTGGLADATDLTLTGTATATFTGDETLASLTGGTGTVDATGVDVTVTGTLDTDGAILVDDLTAGVLDGTSTITATGVVTASAGDFDGNIAAGALTKDTAGTLTISTAQDYAGATTVSAGTLALASGGSINSTASVGIAAGGTLSLGASDQLANAADVTNAGTLALGANSDTVSTYTGGGTVTGTGTLTASTYALTNGAVVDANFGAGNITSNGIVAINGNTGVGSLTVESGTTTLAGAAAATTVQVDDAATLATTATGTLADAAVVTLNGTGALSLGQDETIGNLNGAGSVALGEHRLTLSSGAGATSAAVITGTGGITLVSGTQTLTGDTTYTGDTIVNGGSLILDGTSQSDALFVNGGTLTLNGTANATSATIAVGANLVTGASEMLNDNVVITNNGLLTLGGSETVGAFSGTGTVDLGSFNLTFAGDGDSVSGELISDFSGVISGTTGTLTKNGDDVQVLSGANTYQGRAFVNEGVLRVTNSLALGVENAAGRTNVYEGGTLQLAGNISLNESLRVSGSGAAQLSPLGGNDAGLTNLGAINNLSGNNTISNVVGLIGGNPDIIIGANAGSLTFTGSIIRSVYEDGDSSAPLSRLTFQAATDASIVLSRNVSFVALDNLSYLLNVGDIYKTGGGLLDISAINANRISGEVYIEDGIIAVRREAQLASNLDGSVRPTTVNFGDSSNGALKIAAGATESAIAPAIDQVVSGGDGTFANFRNTTFDFALGDGTLITDTDTAIKLSNLLNFTDRNLIKAGSADLLLDLTGGALAKVLPTLLINSGSVFFLAEDTASLGLSGLGGTGGDLSFGALDVTIDQTASSTFGGNLFGDGNGNLTLNATGSATLTSTGVLSSFASVTIGGDGTGTIDLAGNNTYTGGTNVATGGSVVFTGTSLSATLDIATGGTATLASSDRLVDTAVVTNAGTFDLGANTETVASFTSNGGTLAGTGTLTAATYALNDGTTVDANLGDGAVTTAGTVVVNGNVGNGTVTVSGGLLRLNGATGTGTVTVQTGAELRGVGTNIGGDLVVDLGATFAPGASPGVTVVAGNWTQNGTFAAEIAGTGGPGAANGHDQIQVGGTITLGPASTLDIQRFGTFTEPARGDAFRIIVGNLGTQQFATVTTDFTTGLVLDLADGTLLGTGLNGTNAAGHVDLTTLAGLDANTRALVAAIQGDAYVDGPAGVQINSGTGTDASRSSGQAVRALLTTPAGAGNGINALSPETYAGDSAYATHATRNYASAALGSVPVATNGRYSLFTAYSSHSAGTSSSVNAADYDLSGSGGLLGARAAIGQRSSVGVFVAFDSGEIDSTHRQGDVDGTIFGAFAEIGLGENWTLTAGAALGDYEVDSTRASLFGGRLGADGVGATATNLSLGLSYAMVREARRGFSPYVEFNYSDASSDAFTETGGIDALRVESIDHTSLTGELGARGYVMVGERVSLGARLAVAQEFGDDDTPVSANLAVGGAPFTVVSPGFGETTFRGGLDAQFAVTKAFSLSAGVDIAVATDSDTGTAFRIGGGLSF